MVSQGSSLLTLNEGDHSLVLMISFKHLLVLNNLSESN